MFPDATPLVLLLLATTIGVAYQPDFQEPITNLTVPMGRDATFRCLVHHLGGYRVGWVKADTKAIQAIHDHVITHNPRVSVSHNDHTIWNLHIKSVQEEDRGQYMCQINTDPMKSQLGTLDVVVPPDFISEETSGDIMVPEGGIVKLACKARGHPAPHVLWRREDGEEIIVREPNGQRTRSASYQGEMLKLVKISRTEMGAYMCIASNGVPPTVSKRIMVNVHFHPVIHVPNQLVGAPLNTDVVLECYVEASPKSINYWVRDTTQPGSGGMVISSAKHEVKVISKSLFETKMILIVRNLMPEDLGSYKCIAKNSLGEVESSIRVYEIPGPTRIVAPPDEEDYNDQIGSAERDQDEEVSNNVADRSPLSGSSSNNHHGSNTGLSASGSSTNAGNHVVVALQPGGAPPTIATPRGGTSLMNHVPVDPAPSSASRLGSHDAKYQVLFVVMLYMSINFNLLVQQRI